MECAFRFLPVHQSAFPRNYQEPQEARKGVLEPIPQPAKELC